MTVEENGPAFEVYPLSTEDMAFLFRKFLDQLHWIIRSVFFKWRSSQAITESTQRRPEDVDGRRSYVPTSVNYFFTRQCNYNCGFCFHTATSSFVLPLEESMRGLRLLRESGSSFL